jgi:hypothetical protein
MQTDSFRIPTPADLRALGYSDAHAELLPLMLAEMQQHGWRTPSQLATAVHRSKKVVLEVLNQAHKREHVTKRHQKDREHWWKPGRFAGQIPRHKPDLLSADDLPSVEDFFANGFTPKPAQYAEATIRCLNENDGELSGRELAAKVGIAWPNLGYTLRPLQVLKCVRRIGRRGRTRESDKIILDAAGVRSLLKAEAVQHRPPRKISSSLKSKLDRVDGRRVDGWPLKRQFIEFLAPSRVATLETLANELQCSISGLYGRGEYPGPMRSLEADGLLTRKRLKGATEFTIDESKIESTYPQLSSAEIAAASNGIHRRRIRLGATRRNWNRLDKQMQRWGERADYTAVGVKTAELLTSYFNVAAVVGTEFRGTYAQIAHEFDVHASTVAGIVRSGRDDGFFTIVELLGQGGQKGGVIIRPIGERFRSCAGELLAASKNGRTAAKGKTPKPAAAAALPTSSPPPAEGSGPAVVYGIELRGAQMKPLVGGKEKDLLPAVKYRCLLTLIKAYPAGVRLNQFSDNIGNPHQALKGLIADRDYARELLAPERSGRNSPGWQLKRAGRESVVGDSAE